MGKGRGAMGNGRSAIGNGQSAMDNTRSAMGIVRRAMGHGRSAMGKGRSAVGNGRSAIGNGRSAMGNPRSAMGHGRWAMGKGPWAMGKGACVAAVLVVAIGLASCSRSGGSASSGARTFSSPEEAVQALIAAAKSGKRDEIIAIFGPDGQELADSSDPTTGRRNLQTFTAAAKERWHLTDNGADTKVLVIGNEDWPFPVPLTKDARGWRFDTAAGKEEVLARRIGRNELAVVRVAETYVAAQRLYARSGHDGQPAGLYARKLASDSGRQNGLYWQAKHGEKRSPLGDLVAQAAAEGTTLNTTGSSPSPFHGYYFKILTAQGPAAPGGARAYLVGGRMSGGFALVAWPAQYDVTGVMTFIINHDGILSEKDLGTGTDAAARSMALYDPDPSWTAVR